MMKITQASSPHGRSASEVPTPLRPRDPETMQPRVLANRTQAPRLGVDGPQRDVQPVRDRRHEAAWTTTEKATRRR